jgi:hypothetical protein
MSGKYAHLSDEELVLFADGELSSRNVVQISAHLEACWDCRTRLRQLEETIAEFVDVHHRTLDHQLPPSTGPRALLKARLMESAVAARQGSWFPSFQKAFTLRKLAYVGVALLAAALGTFLGYNYVSSPPATRATVRAVPDPRLTPGATHAVSANDVCTVSYSDDARLLPASIQQRVLQEYGMAGAQAQGYELDYLISPQLGGTDDIRNLWPEPESSTAWNVDAKDALESRLHQLVCQGKINLVTAQRDLATDWISAYKRYFHTDRPIEPL